MADVVDAARLGQVLAARKLTAEEFARLAGYDPATVADYLAGRRTPPEAFGIIAERILHLRPNWLRRVE